jgi:hypothetical protein
VGRAFASETPKRLLDFKPRGPSADDMGLPDTDIASLVCVPVSNSHETLASLEFVDRSGGGPISDEEAVLLYGLGAPHPLPTCSIVLAYTELPAELLISMVVLGQPIGAVQLMWVVIILTASSWHSCRRSEDGREEQRVAKGREELLTRMIDMMR